VVIARAIINNPTILICDEPTGNLDPETSYEIIKILEEVNRRGTTVVVVTHDREIVDVMKKRVLTLEEGCLIIDDATGRYGYEV
jgi:cell division transport system ATP-binding protein